MEHERNAQAELLRTRQRLHKLEATVQGLRLELRFVRDFCKHYGPLIDGMATADKIAEGVANELKARGSAQFTILQKGTAAIVALCSLAAVVLQVALR